MRSRLLCALFLFALAQPTAVEAARRGGRAEKKATARDRAQHSPRTRSPGSEKDARKKPDGLKRVSDRKSVKLADKAVIAHLARPLTLRGPRAERLSKKDARSKIKSEWEILDTRILTNADPMNHPITGNATLVVEARPTSSGLTRPGKNQLRKFLVNIDTSGKATVISEGSASKIASLARRLNERLAVKRIVKDVLRSSGVRKATAGIGVLILAFGGGTLTGGELSDQLLTQANDLGPIVVTAAAIAAKNGLGRRESARLHAFERLTETLDQKLREGETVTVEGAYDLYRDSLREVRIGKQLTKNVEPPPREKFVQALSAWEVERAASASAQ